MGKKSKKSFMVLMMAKAKKLELIAWAGWPIWPAFHGFHGGQAMTEYLRIVQLSAPGKKKVGSRGKDLPTCKALGTEIGKNTMAYFVKLSNFCKMDFFIWGKRTLQDKLANGNVE